MNHLLRAVPEMLRVGVARLVAYRAEMTIWILSASLPLVMLGLWNAVAADGPVAGLGQDDMARYFAATMVVQQLTGSWVVWQLNWEIRSGQLSPRLLRPLHPLVQDAVWMISALPIRVLVLGPILAALVAWRPGLWVAPSAGALALFLLSALLAWTLSFLAQALFGILSFWLEQSLGIFAMWYSAWALLSGYVAPLAVFPDWIRPVLRWLPFRGMFAVPVELLGGFLSPADALPDLALQVAWTAAFLGAVALAWRAGLRRYGAFGA